jgi:hypothetical protein
MTGSRQKGSLFHASTWFVCGLTPGGLLLAGCTWKAVFLGDLMSPDRVKFHYRKAMLVLHPDKNVTGSAEQRFISERVGPPICLWPVGRAAGCLIAWIVCVFQVFTSVNEAYTTFAAQELK